MKPDKKIILEDGSEYYGYGFGANKTIVSEIVFNTSMVGYQEIISDPSYTDQAVVMSYPLIGNYGITDEDFESRMIAPSAFIVREVNDSPSNFRWARGLIFDIFVCVIGKSIIQIFILVKNIIPAHKHRYL